LLFRLELEQISKPEILRKLRQRFGGKTIRDVRFRIGGRSLNSELFDAWLSHASLYTIIASKSPLL
jgi:hypothetical protein